jgi:hypothetical protein
LEADNHCSSRAFSFLQLLKPNENIDLVQKRRKDQSFRVGLCGIVGTNLLYCAFSTYQPSLSLCYGRALLQIVQITFQVLKIISQCDNMLSVRINISRSHGSDLTTGGTEMGRLLRITKRIAAFALCAVILLSSVHVFAESGVSVSIFDRGTAAWSENELPVRDPVETVTKKIRFDLLAGSGTMDVSTSGGTYTITAVPNAGCTFAGHYKQNALTTLVTTQSVLQIPMDQSTNLYRHPLFEG